MKVKEFIDYIRPISALDPDSDLNIFFNDKELSVSHWYYDFDTVRLFLKSSE